MSCLAGGRPTVMPLAQSSARGPSSASALRSTSACDISLTRFQSDLLSPRAILRSISSAEKRAIFSFFRISRSPERDQPDGCFTAGPDDRKDLVGQCSDGYEAFLAISRGRIVVHGAAVEQQRRVQQVEAVSFEVDSPFTLVPLEFHESICPRLCTHYRHKASTCLAGSMVLMVGYVYKVILGVPLSASVF